MALPLAPIIGGAASLLGGIFGGAGERKPLSYQELYNLWGPQALGRDTASLYAMLSRSPAFQGMMTQMAQQGARATQGTYQNIASRGLSTTPYGSFLKAASRGYGSNMQLGGQQNLFLQALQAAMQNMNARQGMWGQSRGIQQQTPSFMSQLGSALLAGGSQGLLNWGTQTTPKLPAEQSFFGSPWHPTVPQR